MTNTKLNKFGQKSYILELFHNISSIFLIAVAYYCLLITNIQEIFIFAILAVVMVMHYLTSRFFFGIPLSLKNKLGDSLKENHFSLKKDKRGESPMRIVQFAKGDPIYGQDYIDDKEESHQSGEDK